LLVFRSCGLSFGEVAGDLAVDRAFCRACSGRCCLAIWEAVAAGTVVEADLVVLAVGAEAAVLVGLGAAVLVGAEREALGREEQES
jgi:hypothetical protein